MAKARDPARQTDAYYHLSRPLTVTALTCIGDAPRRGAMETIGTPAIRSFNPCEVIPVTAYGF
jgi:hypothetical protein